MKKLLVFLFVSLCCNIVLAGSVKDAAIASQRGDHDAAFKILLPLAEAGNVDVLGNVGNKYAFGLGVNKDLKNAFHYWSLSVYKYLGTEIFNITTFHLTELGGRSKA